MTHCCRDWDRLQAYRHAFIYTRTVMGVGE